MSALDQAQDRCAHCPTICELRHELAEVQQQLILSRLVNDGLRREREHLLLAMPTGCAPKRSHPEHRGAGR